MDFQKLNAQINRYLSPQGMGDLNKFLEQMPVRAGYGILIAGGIAWFVAGIAVVYATTLAKDVASIRAELVKSEALKPVVPQIVNTPVPDEEIKAFAEKVNPLYKDVNINMLQGGKITVSATSGQFFGAFREAINHAYNGGQGWRLALNSLCVGRECKGSFLSGEFSVNRIKVQR